MHGPDRACRVLRISGNMTFGTRAPHLVPVGMLDDLATMQSKRKRTTAVTGVKSQTDQQTPESLGGVRTRLQGLTNKESLVEFRRQLGYTLNCSVCPRFPTLAVLLFRVDRHWMADLEVQLLKRWN